jgi:hypothetical protein
VTTDKGVHRTPIEIAESRLVETGDPKFEQVCVCTWRALTGYAHVGDWLCVGIPLTAHLVR